MLDSMIASFVYGCTGIVLSFLGYRVFDFCETRIDFADELKKGNVAVAIVVGCFILGMCFIIGRTVGS